MNSLQGMLADKEGRGQRQEAGGSQTWELQGGLEQEVWDWGRRHWWHWADK